MNISDLCFEKHHQLLERAMALHVENPSALKRSKLIQSIAKQYLQNGEVLTAKGTVELASDGFAFLRSSYNNYRVSEEDIFIPTSLVKRFFMRTGDVVECEIRLPQGEKERNFIALNIHSINSLAPELKRKQLLFEDLTPLHPQRQMHLEREIKADENITGRLIDLFAPIGFGQRALIVAPPKSGKTVMMQHIAHSITTNHPNAHLIVLLIDERPEEVTEMERSVKAEVLASTFDEPAERHVALAEMTIEKAKRLCEQKKDVIIVLDSITRLARAYNTVVPNSGKVLSGGVEAHALQRPKRFFGAARNIEEGGSLTIIATALVDTGSRMDEVIYEEFKGTGNMEIHLDRRLSERRVYPSMNIARSGTRREELLLEPDVLQKIWLLRKFLSSKSDELESTEIIVSKLRETKNNAEFLEIMRKGA